MKSLGIVLVPFIFLTVPALNEQTLGQVISTSSGNQEGSAAQAVKFDEYEMNGASFGDMKARLDGFFDELQKDPRTRAYIFMYGSKRSKARYRSRSIKSYLELRGLPSTRLKIINGGNRPEPMLEFWVVRIGVERPSPSPPYNPARRRKH
jgi:hypothetical protein